MKRNMAVCLGLLLFGSILGSVFHDELSLAFKVLCAIKIADDNRYTYRQYPSPSGKNVVTAFVYIDALSFNYNEIIYILPYEYTKRSIPSEANIIIFPADALVAVQWNGDDSLTVTSNYPPVANDLKIRGVVIETRIGRKFIDEIEGNGGEILPMLTNESTQEKLKEIGF
jgi:hypothetical protein